MKGNRKMDKYQEELLKIMQERGYSGLTIDTVISITILNPRAKMDMLKLLKENVKEREVIVAVQPYIKELRELYSNSDEDNL